MNPLTPDQESLAASFSEQVANLDLVTAAQKLFADVDLNAEPANPALIALLEEEVKASIPPELADLWRQTNGLSVNGIRLISGVEDARRSNAMIRALLTENPYHPMDDFFVFGGLGNGDLFYVNIGENGKANVPVFHWDHESDARTEYAPDLLGLLIRHAVTITQ